VDSFTSKRIGVLTGEAYHELAFWYPVLRFRELEATVTVLGRDAERTYRSRLGYPVLSNVSTAAERGTDFDVIIGAGERALGVSGILKGRRVSAVAEMRSELHAFGAECIDAPVMIDGSMITARSVEDIPAFFRALLTALETADPKFGHAASRR
jgi:protease I